jgi:hypothetical protein
MPKRLHIGPIRKMTSDVRKAMKEATITFKATQGGALGMLTAYEGGYDSENPAHLAAAMLGQKMNDLAEPQGDPVNLTQAEVDALQQSGADLPTHAAPQLVIARA